MAQAAQGGDQIDIVYIGNPVMDITVSDPERDIMGRYSLELGMASLVTPEQMPIYDELWAREDKLVSPGGSALNSARAQMHANPQGSVGYFGCIGNDTMGSSLTEAVGAANILGKFEISEEECTSRCATVIVNRERTLCAHIASARKFSNQYLEANMVSNLSECHNPHYG